MVDTAKAYCAPMFADFELVCRSRRRRRRTRIGDTRCSPADRERGRVLGLSRERCAHAGRDQMRLERGSSRSRDIRVVDECECASPLCRRARSTSSTSRSNPSEKPAAGTSVPRNRPIIPSYRPPPPSEYGEVGVRDLEDRAGVVAHAAHEVRSKKTSRSGVVRGIPRSPS